MSVEVGIERTEGGGRGEEQGILRRCQERRVQQLRQRVFAWRRTVGTELKRSLEHGGSVERIGSFAKEEKGENTMH